MNMDRSVIFNNCDCNLHGVLAEPANGTPPGSAGILFLGGWGGYRIGPHRMFVRAARHFAAAGFPSLRFDYRGRGESEGVAGEATISTMITDAAAGVTTLCAEARVERVILLGICSGGKVAMGAAPHDPRIVDIVLWSADPLDHSIAAAARRRRKTRMLLQYGGKLFRAATWRKLFGGNLNPDMVARALAGDERPVGMSAEEAKRDRRILDDFRVFKGEVYFIYGGQDPMSVPAQNGFAGFCCANRIGHRIDVIPGADHNYASLDWERQVFEKTLAWLGDRMKAGA